MGLALLVALLFQTIIVPQALAQEDIPPPPPPVTYWIETHCDIFPIVAPVASGLIVVGANVHASDSSPVPAGDWQWSVDTDLVSVSTTAFYPYASAAYVTSNTPGRYDVHVSYIASGQSLASGTLETWFVGVKRVEAQVCGDWVQLDGTPKEVILRGSKYQFKAIPEPENTPCWPGDYPTWDYDEGLALSNRLGQLTFVEFLATCDDRQIDVRCGSSSEKTVEMDVIAPHVSQIKLGQYDIYDKKDWWGVDTNSVSGHGVGCYKAGEHTTVKTSVTESKQLTFESDVLVWGESSNPEVTGGDYFGSQVTFGTTWPVIDITLNSDTDALACVASGSTSIAWKYKVIGGRNEWVGMGISNNIRNFLVLDAPQSPQVQPWYDVLCSATDYANADTDATSAVRDITATIFDWASMKYDGAQHYTYYESSDPYSEFHLAAFLQDRQSFGVVEADCRDFANWFQVVAGALGIQTQFVVLDRTTAPGYFDTRDILPAMGEWTSVTWNFHQVGWWNSHVADASLKLDLDNDPEGHTDKLSSGDMTQAEYVDKLTDTPDVANIYTAACNIR